MLENILQYIIVTLLGLLVSTAGWLVKRVLQNSNDILSNQADIERLIQLAEQKENFRMERHTQIQRELQSLASKIDALQMMLIEITRQQADSSPSHKKRGTGGT